MAITRRTLLQGFALVSPVRGVKASAQDQTWTVCAPMPVTRSEMPATVLNGIIFVAGGFGASNLAHSYDPVADMWNELPQLPVDTNHPGITTWGDLIIVAGGYANDGGAAHDEIWALDPGGGDWEQIGVLPHQMGAFGFAAGAGGLFVSGGAIGSLNGEPTDETWSWEPAEDIWTRRAPLPRAREHLAVAMRDDLLHIIGGRVHGMASPDLGEALDVYDATTDTWTAGNPLSPPRSGLNGANSCAGVVVAGGETPTGVFADVDLLDPVTGKWEALPDLTVPVHGVAIAAAGSAIFAIGGSKSAGMIDNTSAVWRLDLDCGEA